MMISFGDMIYVHCPPQLDNVLRMQMRNRLSVDYHDMLNEAKKLAEKLRHVILIETRGDLGYNAAYSGTVVFDKVGKNRIDFWVLVKGPMTNAPTCLKCADWPFGYYISFALKLENENEVHKSWFVPANETFDVAMFRKALRGLLLNKRTEKIANLLVSTTRLL